MSPKPSRPAPRRRSPGSPILLLPMLFLVALAWFTIRIGEPPAYYHDEIFYAHTAGRYTQGHFDPNLHGKGVDPRTGVAYVWNHPPLGMLLIAAAISVWGDGPLGWRLPSAAFGALGVVLAYALALAVTRRRNVALLTSLFLMFDGLYFVQARIGMIDMFVAVFMLGAILALWRYLTSLPESRASQNALLAVGACLGLALATKWNAAYGAFLIGLTVLARTGWLLRSRTRLAGSGRGASAPRLAWGWVLLALGLVPAAIYLAAYLPLFLSGWTFGDFLGLQRRMLGFHAGLTASHPHASSWWQWPLVVRPVKYLLEITADPVTGQPDWGTFVYAGGNPLLFWAFLPALAYVAISGWRRQRLVLLVLAIGFFGQWLPWALVPRITYASHFLAAVPFGALALAMWLSDGLVRGGRWRALALTYAALVVLAFAFFYPLWAAVPIHKDAFELRIWFESWR